VVCGTAGRTALPAAWTGARRAGVPFLLWSALWAHPRTAAHAAGTALLRAIYRDAHAVVAYGPHVAAFATRQGARRVEIAPQAVDGAFWSHPPAAPTATAATRFTALFVGRDEPGKGLDVLEEAWIRTHFTSGDERLVLVGVEGRPGAVGPRTAEEVRNFLGSADVVVVPSRRTRTFREPWGLVCNEAMHAGTPVIATDEVGAAAGGLVRDGRNGLVVPSEDPATLAGALRALRGDPVLRARLGAAAREDVAPYTFEAWAAGFARALA
jgi:glycosyltransferase involved in cell wall biosynthesis